MFSTLNSTRLVPLLYFNYFPSNLTSYAGTGLKYEIGEALAVYGQNDTSEVAKFLNFYKLNPKELVALPFKGASAGQVHVRTIEQIFVQYPSIF